MPDTPWKPKRSTVVVLGLLSLWPFLYMGLFFAFFAFSFVWFQSRKGGDPDFFKYIFPLHCATMLLMFALIAVYIVHLFRTDRIPADKKALWAVVLFLGNMMAFPIYWYLYLWRQPQEASGQPPAEPISGDG